MKRRTLFRFVLINLVIIGLIFMVVQTYVKKHSPIIGEDITIEQTSMIVITSIDQTTQVETFETTEITTSEWTKVITQVVTSQDIPDTTNIYDQIRQEISDRGAYGKLLIDDVGVSVPIFYEEDGKKWQQLTDDPDSACAFLFSFSSTLTIADHSYQGFDKIKMSVENETIAQIVTKDQIQQYKCLKIFPNAINDRRYLRLPDGSIAPKIYNDPNYIFTYTCNDDEADTITLIVWERF